MSIWHLNETYSFNDVNNCICSESTSTEISGYTLDFLRFLIKQNLMQHIPSDDEIIDAVWFPKNDKGYDYTNISTLAGNIRKAMGNNTDAIIRSNGKFCINYDIGAAVYYKDIWEKHIRGSYNPTSNFKDLIEYYVLPSQFTQGPEEKKTYFSDSKYRKLITAGSGFGKSSLLHIMLMCCLTKKKESGLFLHGIDKTLKDKYNDFYTALFGSNGKSPFPVFIDSNNVNSKDYSTLLDLADGNQAIKSNSLFTGEEKQLDIFESMVNNAYAQGELLFLIDSIDEVNHSKLQDYLLFLEKELTQKYPDARAVIASRPLGDTELCFINDTVELNKLSSEDIKTLVELSITDTKKASELYQHIQNDSLLYRLAENPFMLNVIIGHTPSDVKTWLYLEPIVNATVNRRWLKNNFDSNIKTIFNKNVVLLMFGKLACNTIFCDAGNRRITEDKIKASFCAAAAENNLKVQNEDIDNYLPVLSSQSGIIEAVTNNYVEEYVFQDELVRCWLAAYYIKHKFDNNYFRGKSGFDRYNNRRNAYILDECITQMYNKELPLSENAVDVLIMLLVMYDENNNSFVETSILYYLITRDALSIDSSERAAIRAGYEKLIGNTFGVNSITNLKEGESAQLINRITNTDEEKNK